MDISQRQSQDIGELIKASIAASREYTPLEADNKSNYGEFATSDAIKYCTEEALSNHGLRFYQGPVVIDGVMLLESFLGHSSGQWKAWYSFLPLESDTQKDKNKVIGASSTYQRRYSAYGILGLGKGDGTVDPDNVQNTYVKPSQTEPQKSLPTGKPGCISDKQLGLLRAKMGGNKEMEADICKQYKIDTLSDLPWKHMNEVLKYCESKGQTSLVPKKTAPNTYDSSPGQKDMSHYEELPF